MDTDGPGGSSKAQLVSALVVVGAIVTLLAFTARTAPESAIHQIPRVGYGSRPPPPRTGLDSGPTTGQPDGQSGWLLDLLFQLLMAALIVGGVGLVAAAVIMVVRTVNQGDSVTERDAPQVEQNELIDMAAVGAHLAQSSATLDVDGDVNASIVRCWQGLERIAERAGVTRDRALTAKEFTRLTLNRTTLPSDSIDTLADLYEAALFSGEQLPERARADALHCLERLHDAVSSKDPR